MKLKSNHKRPARVELIPLIDVVFLLLVFFIYSIMSISHYSVIPVHLPGVESGERMEEQEPFVILISRDGGIRIEDEDVTVEGLEKRLAAEAEYSRRVLIAGDEDASYRAIMEVCDAVRKSGMTDFAFQLKSITAKEK